MKKRAFVIALLPCLPALAQTEAGIQASFVFPQSDVREAVDGRTGLQAGVHAAINLQGGHELRPRADVLFLSKESAHIFGVAPTPTVRSISVGLDYLRFVEERRRGLYGATGLGFHWWQTQRPEGGSERKISPALMVGGGFRFDSALSVEFNVEFGSFRDHAGTATLVKTGVSYRF
jgi:hypothetical protein